MLENQERLQPRFVVFAPIRHIDPPVRTAQHGADRQNDHFLQIMPPCRSSPGVLHIRKRFLQGHLKPSLKTQSRPDCQGVYKYLA